jgi:hypothetical protein
VPYTLVNPSRPSWRKPNIGVRNLEENVFGEVRQ